MDRETTSTHDWQEAGQAWGARATDWAYLWEPYARAANQVVFDRLAVADGTRLLDIACGSGFAAHLASERGAAVSGIDASERLVTIARARTPNGDFRVGDMFALPFPTASFDATWPPGSSASGAGPSPWSTNGPTPRSPSARSSRPVPRSRRYGQSASTASATPCAASSSPCTSPESGSASPPNSTGSPLALDRTSRSAQGSRNPA
jgi:hypothetical protein